MILIIGAGPAGLAAAVRASEAGAQVTVLDDNSSLGGQIWRGEATRPSTRQAALWLERFHASSLKIIQGAQAISANATRRTVLVETDSGALEIQYSRLILATGARELFLPFPGWTLPNVLGVGGLQALVKSGLDIAGKRIVVAGSGPLLLAAASYFRKHGATVPLIAEQTSWSRLLRFGLSLTRQPAKLWQAIQFRLSLAGTRYLPGHYVQSAHGDDAVRNVQLRHGRKSIIENCDYLAVAYGFRPNTELAALLGCEIKRDSVQVNEFQQTSLEDVYCAGEGTGIGGVDLSLVEGEIAGYAAAGTPDRARHLFSKRRHALRFANALNNTSAPRPELRSLVTPDTIVCRCEDVPFARLESAHSWRSAKLHFRCGMGPCQGRICGPAVEFLFGWQPESMRAPIFPARISTLVQEALQK